MRPILAIIIQVLLVGQLFSQDLSYTQSPPMGWGERTADHLFQASEDIYWTATGDSLFRLHSGVLVNIGEQLQTSFGPITDINGTSVHTIVATLGQGLFIFDADGLSQLNMTNGLPSDNCHVVYIDERDYIWVGTDLGLAKIRLQKGGELEISTFTEDNGLPHPTVTDVLKTGKDLWVTTKGGTILFQERKEVEADIQVNITNIWIDGRDTTLQSEYELNHEMQKLRVDLEITNNLYHDPIEYKYKFLGLDTAFIYTHHPWIEVRSLPVGQYKLIISARPAGGLWTAEQASISFDVREPYHQTWWFQAIPANLALIVLLIFYFIRVRQIRAREKQRTEFNKRLSESELKALRSQMDPHFIFNSLNSISHFVTNNDSAQANKYLSKFAKLMRMILESSKNLTIPIEDELELIQFYMELEALRFDEPFTFQIKIADDLDAHNQEIPTMLIQPFVENAIWHGLTHKDEPGHILIELEQHGDTVSCSISDDGVGREATKKMGQKKSHKSMGMDVTRERLQLLNELGAEATSFEVEDVLDDAGQIAGTRVRIDIPIS
jgi:hypothetical protein